MKRLFHEELLTDSDKNKSHEELTVPFLTDSNSNLQEFRTARHSDTVIHSLNVSSVKRCLNVGYIPLLRLSDEIPKQLLQSALKHEFSYYEGSPTSSFSSTKDRDLSKFVTAFTSLHYSLGEHIPYLLDAIRSMTDNEYGYESLTLLIDGEGVLGVMVEDSRRLYGSLETLQYILPNFKYMINSRLMLGNSLVIEKKHSHFAPNIATVKVRNMYEVEAVMFNLNEALRQATGVAMHDKGETFTEDSFVPVELSEESISAISRDLFEEGKSTLYIKNSFGNGGGITVIRVYEGYVASEGEYVVGYYNTVLDLLVNYKGHALYEITTIADTGAFNYALLNGNTKEDSLSVTSLRSGELYVVKYGKERLVKYWKTRKLVVVDKQSGEYIRYSGTNFGNTFTVDNTEIVIRRANSEDAAKYNDTLRYIANFERNIRESNWSQRLIFRKRHKLYSMTPRYNSDLETQLFSESLFNVLMKFADKNSVAKTLTKISSLGYYKDSTRNITIKADQSMTYTPAGKETVITDGYKWSSKGRQSSKYGKLIRKVLSEQVPRKKFTDHEIEKLVNSIKGEYSVGNFSIVEGEDIRHWYDGSNHHNENVGTLGSSCMRHEQCLPWLDIYTENPNQVKLVILTKDDLLKGRALLWDNKWLDRIYGTDATISAFKSFARDKGFWCKEHQDSSTCNFVSPDGNETESSEDISIMLDHIPSDDDGFPYLDTFYYLNIDSGELSGYLSSRDEVTELRSTEGEHSNLEEREYDDWDHRYIYSGDAVYIDSRGINTHIDNATYCEYSGEYILNDDAVELLDGEYIHESHAIYVDYNGGYVRDCDDMGTCAQSGTEFSLEHSDYHVTDADEYVLVEYYEEYLEEMKESE